MSKYINADALKANVKEMEVFIDSNDFEYDIDHRMLAYLLEQVEKSLIDIIDNMEAVDVAPVVYSEWCDDEYFWKCDRCDAWLEVTQQEGEMNFCPHCGAHMMNA